jgi:hypothetical protein
MDTAKLVGMLAADAVVAVQAVGMTPRVIHPGTAYTMELRTNRVNLYIGPNGRVSKATVG